MFDRERMERLAEEKERARQELLAKEQQQAMPRHKFRSN